MKRYNSGIARGKKYIGQGMGKWYRTSMPSLSTHFHVFTNLGSSLQPLHLGYLCTFHHMGMMDHKLHSQHLSPLWRMVGSGSGLKIPSFQSWLSLSRDQPSAKSSPKERQDVHQSIKENTKALPKINKGCYDRSLSEVWEGLPEALGEGVFGQSKQTMQRP